MGTLRELGGRALSTHKGIAELWHTVKLRRVAAAIVTYLILTIGGIAFSVPFYWMVMSSLKPIDEIFTFPIQWWPKVPQWQNYVDAFTFLPFGSYLWNSAKITVLNIIGTLFSCTLAAYGFARLQFKGRNVLFMLILGTMMLPAQVSIIPLFVMFSRMRWINTYYPLIVPSFFGNALYIFMMRQYFTTIPVELEEAARIDGCGYLRTFLTIFLPLCKPVLVTVTLFTFMGVWNDFFNPLLYINSPHLNTVALGLAQYQSEFGSYWHLMMASSVVAILPCLLIFFFFQRYFVEGIAATGLKG